MTIDLEAIRKRRSVAGQFAVGVLARPVGDAMADIDALCDEVERLRAECSLLRSMLEGR